MRVQVLSQRGASCLTLWPAQQQRRPAAAAAAAALLPTSAAAHQRRHVRCRGSGSGSDGNGAGASSSSSDDGGFADDAASGLGKLRYNKREQDLPPELRGLEIRGDDLVDTKTGKVINEFGATRFDVAVRALRGELDPPAWTDNSERNESGLLISKLTGFPTKHVFTAVGRTGDPAARQAFVDDVVAAVARVNQLPAGAVADEDVSVSERMGGKYASVSVTCVVRAPELLQETYDELRRDARVKMAF